MKKKTLLAAIISLLTFLTPVANACTNLIVGKKASTDGSVMCSYNCDGFGFSG
ncbi:MAG: C69 family dipeptidase, partial [Bacteroidales bacterium]|nr:C69 family dipeptidase [Bacteroidales bacterium]